MIIDNPEEPEVKTDKEQVKTDNKVNTTADTNKNPEKTIGQKVKDGLNKLYDGAIRADVKAKNFKQNLIDDYKSRRERIENEESLKRLEKFAKDHKANRDILDKIANIKANMNNAGGEKTVQDYLDNAREQVRGKQGATQNTNTRGTTDGRPKNDTTKVYVHPTSGPALTYSVRGANNANGDGAIVVSGSFTIYNGTQASITNRVYEEGKPYAQLHFERTVYADAWTYGVWSPDSTRNYTVYG